MSLIERERVLGAFLDAGQDGIARACFDLARALAAGGTLVAHGTGAAATDAAHVAVEFMHPVIVGKRALPAHTRADLARPGDVLLAIAHGAPGPATAEVLARRELMTIALLGAGADADADHVLSVPSDDPQIVQEVQETTYHVLWELVHVFFEHPGLMRDACITCGDNAVPATIVAVDGVSAVVERGGVREEVAVDLVEEAAVGDVVLCHAGVALERVEGGFLYPFLDEQEDDPEPVLAHVRASTLLKGEQVSALRRAIDLQQIERCAAAIRARLDAGGRLLAFGNGGSSTDAQDVAIDWSAAGRQALALTDDVATVTAVANDVGFELAFARQLIALARPGDVALAISTSGSSPNVVAGLEEARRLGLLTCALTGYDGGRLAGCDWLDHLIVVSSDDIPRLQEVHGTLCHLLLEAVGGTR
jgi:D-sedoheptulose 7-phosphate isomerase